MIGIFTPSTPMWTVYILHCADGSLYTGVTTDLDKRLAQHRGERPGGARYTRARRPLILVWSCDASDRSQALKREAAIKKLSKQQKLALIAGHQTSDSSSAATTDNDGIGSGGRAGCAKPRPSR